MTAERQLLEAVRTGAVGRAAEILQEGDEAFDVNWVEPDNSRPHLALNALQLACFDGHVEMVRLLLSHPKTDVNRRTSLGQTPLRLACFDGRTEVLRVLLRDPRLDLCHADDYGRTAVWMIAWCGYENVLRVLIGSGRELERVLGMRGRVVGYQDLEDPWAVGSSGLRTPTEAARMRGNGRVVELLDRFLKDPRTTRHEVRRGLREVYGDYEDDSIAGVFATIVLLCDGFLAPREAEERGEEGDAGVQEGQRRFLGMATRLPMELQMVLSHRMHGSSRTLISRVDSEVAFRLVLLS